MFLFTHADEIKDVPDSIEEAQKHLLGQVKQIIEGTNDDDVKSVLVFMRTSLQKGYPFVVVFHPLKTDFVRLVKIFEKKIKPIQDLGRSGNGSMTLPSQIRLGAEARKLVRSLRVALKQDDLDFVEVQETVSTFAFFDKYIDFEDVRSAILDCNGMIVNHVANTKNVIENE